MQHGRNARRKTYCGLVARDLVEADIYGKLKIESLYFSREHRRVFSTRQPQATVSKRRTVVRHGPAAAQGIFVFERFFKNVRRSKRGRLRLITRPGDK